MLTDRIKIIDVFDLSLLGKEINIKGWVRTKRESKSIIFITINDGSTIKNIQVIVDRKDVKVEKMSEITTGASLSITGRVVKSQGKEQNVELLAANIEVYGIADPDNYPLQPKRHSLEFLREIAHLRFRTNTFGAIARIRHSMIFAVHNFFNDKGFFNIHTPIITNSDAEGAGEMFRVTTLDINNPPRTKDGQVNFSKDFFGKETNLTVSGQLEGELAALALSNIYTFGPTFRAENSNTTRHLSEFWMIEPEMAFYDITDTVNLAEEFLKYLMNYALKNCIDDLNFLNKRFREEERNKKESERSSMDLLEKLKFIAESHFVRITYTEAISILKNSKPNKKKKFQFLIDKWGIDLQSEHEKYLVEKHFKKPVVVTDYPKEIKAFYMKCNTDNKTVRAMDVLFPEIGEIIGGSQREENHDQLVARMNNFNIPIEEMQWFLDTRRYGTVPHSGFGLGFERLMLFVTGMKNIRDVIPFPRTPQNADF